MTEELFVVGDVVRFHRGEFSHVALYIGRGNIIHLWSPASAFSVRIDSIRHVQNCQRHVASAEDAAGDESDVSMPQQYTREMDAKMLRDHRAEPFGGDEIVRRARTRLGEPQYDYLSYNCEHFVTWARYGVGASPQARSHTNQVLAGALLGAAVGGIAGLVVGGAISLFSKMTALSASSSGMGVDELSVREVEEEGEGEEVSASEDEDDDARQQRRRDERERLLESIASIQLEEDGGLGEFEAWAASRQQGRAKSTTRAYSDDRHNALAARLADDKLLCGICFYDLQLTRAVAFPCDHFTCTKCHDALVTNGSGFKCCPYCRMNITSVQSIHRSTKRAARNRLIWEQEIATAAATATAAAAPSV